MSAITRVSRLAAALGVATAITLGLPATPAHAAVPGVLTAYLTVQGGNGSDCTITISGTIGMPASQAQSYIDNGARGRFEIWGEDPVYDNRLIKLSDMQLFVSRSGNGLILQVVRPVRCSVLDEDVFVPPYSVGEDEIYAKVVFDSPSGSRLTTRTNTSHGYHGFGEGPLF